VVEFKGIAVSPAPVHWLSPSPSRLDFREVALGEFSTQGVEFTNASADPVTISDVIATGSGVTASGPPLPAVVAPGASATLNVKFTPATVGAVTGGVTLRCADQAEPLTSVESTGIGIAALPFISSVSVRSASVEATESVQLVADVVAVGAIDSSVTWSVEPGSLGAVDAVSGVYRAPDAAGTYRVRATSVADPAQAGVGVVTVLAPPPPPAVAVAVSPTSASLIAGGSRTFAATVSGTTSTAVTWSVQEGAAGGSITSAGVYTAPASAAARPTPRRPLPRR
jgi:hypothetical protein